MISMSSFTSSLMKEGALANKRGKKLSFSHPRGSSCFQDLKKGKGRILEKLSGREERGKEVETKGRG